MTFRFTSLWCRYFEIFPSMNRQKPKMNIHFQKITSLPASFLGHLWTQRDHKPSFSEKEKKKEKEKYSLLYISKIKQTRQTRKSLQTDWHSCHVNELKSRRHLSRASPWQSGSDLCKSEGSVGEPLVTTGHQINTSEAELSSGRERNIAKASWRKKNRLPGCLWQKLIWAN